MSNPPLSDLLIVMLVKGRYLKRIENPMMQMAIFDKPAPEPKERYKLCDRSGSPVLYIENAQLVRFKLWRVIKKDNELAYRKQIDRYYISRRKILSLRKNNPIKRIYKQLRAEKKV